MNTSPASRAGRGSIRSALVGLLLAMCILGLLAGAADLVVNRSIPWGQHVQLEVWTSIAAPLPIEQAMGYLIDAQPAPTPTWWEQAGQALSRCMRWAWQASVTVRTDRAAVLTEGRSTAIFRVPQAIAVADGELLVTVDALGDAGAVSLTVVGGRQTALAAGCGADFALVPSSDGRGWVPLADGWRDIVEGRFQAGQPVGRLTIVNLGLRRASQGGE